MFLDKFDHYIFFNQNQLNFKIQCGFDKYKRRDEINDIKIIIIEVTKERFIDVKLTFNFF